MGNISGQTDDEHTEVSHFLTLRLPLLLMSVCILSPELFYTERAHVRSLKIIDRLFHRPMAFEGGHQELARYLFPNLDQMIELHSK